MNSKKLERLFNHTGLIFIIFTFITGIVYFICRYAGFVTDFIGFEQGYDKCGYFHIYDCANLKNFRYLQHIFSWVLYKSVGSDTIYWYILYIVAHGAAATSVYLFLRKLCTPYLSFAKWFAFLSALLFLVSPYQSEVVVWKVCIQYCTVVITVFLGMYLMLRDCTDQKKYYPALVMFLFLFGLFSLEQTVILPFALLLIFLFLNIGGEAKHFRKRFFITYFLPQFISILGFFSLSKIFYGKWVMHYGSGSFVHLFSFDTIGKVYTYFFKTIFLIRDWPHEWKMKFVSIMDNPWVNLPLSVILLFVLIYLGYEYTRGDKMKGLLALFILLYGLSLIPVVQLYMTMLLHMEGDRLGYVSSAFIMAILVLLLYELRSILRNVFLLLFFTINIYYSLLYAQMWEESRHVMWNYLDSFNYNGTQKVFVLGIPDNYKGFLEFRRYGDESGLEEALQYRKKDIYQGKIIEVVQFNQMTMNDGMKVTALNDSTLHVEFNQYGNWFWREGIGASDHETPNFKFHLLDWGYEVTLRNFDRKRDIVLYPQNGRFVEYHWK